MTLDMIAQKVQDIASREIARCELKLSRLESEMAIRAYTYREHYALFSAHRGEHGDLQTEYDDSREKMRESDEALRAAIREIVELSERQEAWRVVRDHCADVDMARGLHPSSLVGLLAKRAYENAKSGAARSGQSDVEQQQQDGGPQQLARGSKRIREIIKKALDLDGDLLATGGDEMLETRRQLCCKLCLAD